MQRFRSVIANSKTDRNPTPTPARFCAGELKNSVVLMTCHGLTRELSKAEQSLHDDRDLKQSLLRLVQCSNVLRKQKKQLQMRKLFPTDFVPQPSWSSDEEEALVSFLLLYSSSHSWTFCRTDVSLCKNPSLVQYQTGVLASLVGWYCELAALLTARLTLLSSSITHRFCWMSSLFQRDVCFVIDSKTP